MNIQRIRIADTESNRSSLFWKNHIGKNGVWTSTSADGLCDIVFDDPPVVVEGVLPERFEVRTDASTLPARYTSSMRRFFYHMEVIAIVLGIFALTLLIYWKLR